MRAAQYEENAKFLQRADAGIRALFEAAKTKDELNFAASLSPEFRPYKRNSAVDAQYAFADYSLFLGRENEDDIRPRIALAFYSHLAEASGFWEVLKNLLEVARGQKFNVMPFAKFTARYGASVGSTVPNANRLMRSLVKSSSDAGFSDLQTTFGDAFDSDLRNAYAHADYSLAKEGIFVLSRYNHERQVSWRDFNILLDRAIHLYLILNDIRVEHCERYIEPKQVIGSLNERDPAGPWLIEFKGSDRAMNIFNGHAMLQFASYPNLPIFKPSEV